MRPARVPWTGVAAVTEPPLRGSCGTRCRRPGRAARGGARVRHVARLSRTARGSSAGGDTPGSSPSTGCRPANSRSARTPRYARLLSGRPRSWPAGCAQPPCSRGRADQAGKGRGYPRRPAAATGHGGQTVPAVRGWQADRFWNGKHFRGANDVCSPSGPQGRQIPGTAGVWSSTTTTSLTDATHCGQVYYHRCRANLANASPSRSNAG
jgi:hypothetical protein